MRRIVFALVALFASAHVCAAQLDHGDLVTFPSRPGVTQGIFIESPSPNPPAVVVLYGGNEGALHLDATGATTLKGNFLIRTASYWVNKGYAAVLVDTPSDYANGVEDFFRIGSDALADQKSVVGELRKRFPQSKIVLVGTSRGTATVGNVLANDPALADAYVLTSPVTIGKKNKPGLTGLRFKHVDPKTTLIVANHGDRCSASYFSGADHFASSNDLTLVAEDSSDGEDDCGGHSPHGFLGIEVKTLDDINAWLIGLLPSAAK